MGRSFLRACLATGLVVTFTGCSVQPPDPVASEDTGSRPALAEPALHLRPLPSSSPSPHPAAIVLGFEGDTLRLQLDTIAYAPLADASMSYESDPEIWRRALPESMRRMDGVDESWWGCDGGDRVVHFRDTANRNQVQLRTCLPDADTALMTGFVFHDNVVALANGLTLGDARDHVLEAMGLSSADLPTPASTIRKIEVVNEEDNNTVRFHFDAAGVLARVDYEPYSG